MSYRVLVNGAEFESATATGDADVQEISPGLFSVLHNGKSYNVRLLGGHASGYEAIVDGHTILVELQDPRDAVTSRQAGEQSGRIDVKSAMPGKVVRLLVAEGDSVEQAQSLIVVEAMKMQNELKSPKSGRVLKVNAAEGDTVRAGQVLIVLE